MIDQPARRSDVTHEFDDGRGSDPVSPEHRRAAAGRGWSGRGWSGVGALGALSFGLVHFYWAVGGRLGLPAEVGPISGRTWFLVYDLVAGLAFVVFAGGAAVLAAGRGSRRLQAWLVRARRGAASSRWRAVGWAWRRTSS